jgi:hypothetical protein
VIPEFSEKKLNLFFSFLSCSVALGFGVSGGIPQKTVDLFTIFRWGRGLKGESEFGPLISIRWMGAPLSSPTLAAPSPSPQLGCRCSPPSLALLPIGSRPLPSPWLPPPSRSPHAARIEKRRSTLNWRGREDQGDVLPHFFLKIFLGKILGMDEILVPPCNYVLLEVVDHGD